MGPLAESASAHVQSQLTQNQHQLAQASISWHRPCISWHRPGPSKPRSAPPTRTSFWSTRESLWPSWPYSPSWPAGSLPAGCCDPSGPSPARHEGSPRPTCTSAWPSTAREDELKELGDTLDDLFGRLDAAFEAQRHFVANASHELRTPLTAERTLLQVALDDPDTTTAAWRSTAEEVLASSDEQARLIEALLTLASSESGLNGHEPVDLAATVAATLVDLQPEIDRLGIHVDEATRRHPSRETPCSSNGSSPTCSTTPFATTWSTAASRS